MQLYLEHQTCTFKWVTSSSMKQEADKAGGPIAQTTSHDTSTHPASRLPYSTDKYEKIQHGNLPPPTRTAEEWQNAIQKRANNWPTHPAVDSENTCQSSMAEEQI